jgi:GntR family transcriptional regulator, histidine utilization repressor
MNEAAVKTDPLYLQVKQHIKSQIDQGVWGATDRIPSENELIETLGVSKMTVNRALRELADEGTLVRIVGVGSFVAKNKIDIRPLEVRNIADEIRGRGHTHSASVKRLAQERPSQTLAGDLGLKEGSTVFHSVILHLEESEPVQLEDRYVNPEIAPRYLEQDFTETTPAAYLMAIAPIQDVEHYVEALIPGGKIASLLNMKPGEPCLMISRRTWTRGITASGARLYYPGSTYRLGEPRHAHIQDGIAPGNSNKGNSQ